MRELAEEIISIYKKKDGALRVTWYNHYSFIRVADSLKREFDLHLIDGTFLQLVLRFFGFKVRRSSADILFPTLFDLLPNVRYLLIGGEDGESTRVARHYKLEAICLNGFDDLIKLGPDGINDLILSQRIDVVILGLGPNLQEEVGSSVEGNLKCLILTCGGWITQYGNNPKYFHEHIHKLRLGWLVRLIREPKRLYRRYSLDVVLFLTKTLKVREFINNETRPMASKFGFQSKNLEI